MIAVSNSGHELLESLASVSSFPFEPGETFSLISKRDDRRVDGAWLYGSLVKRFAKRARNVSVGRNRVVFDMGKYVVKIPRCADGESDNDWEGSVSNGPDSDPLLDVQYARTRLAYWKDVPVLFMERVEEIVAPYLTQMLNFNEPDWVASVDCSQVGFTKDCRLVAYDYGMK